MPNYGMEGGFSDQNIQPATSLTRTDYMALAGIAMGAVSSYNAHKMDQIRWKTQQQQRDFQRKYKTEQRIQNGWIAQRNRENIRQAQWAEKLVFEVDAMKKTAQAINEASAIGVSNVSAAAKDIQKQKLRADISISRANTRALEENMISNVDANRSKGIIYDANPAQPASQAMYQFGIGAANTLYEAYKPVEGA